jgi:hypothetical protein
MKTKTILDAWGLAAQEAEIYADDIRKLQRACRIYNGLVRRIVAGERAREELAAIKATSKERELSYLEWLENMK